MNGYIQLEIGGKPRGFKFGLWVIGQIIDELNIGVEQFDEELQRNPIKSLTLLMYYSAFYNAIRKGEDADFNQLDVYDWIDETGGLGSETMVKFQTAFSESMTKDVPEVKGKKG